MAIDSIKRRVARLEEKASVQDHQELARVAALIEAGSYYDELTDEEKAAFERTFTDENGELPESIASTALNE